MQEISLDRLLYTLESVTAETQSYLTEEADDDENKHTVAKVVSFVTQEFNAIKKDISDFEGTTVKVPDYQQLIRDASNAVISEDDYIYTYSKIDKPLNVSGIKNNDASFAYALAEIKKHSDNPSESFKKQDVINGAIGAGAKHIIGSDCPEKMTLTDFKKRLYDDVLGTAHVKKDFFEIRSDICSNYRTSELIIKNIDNVLIRQHISSLTRYQTSLLKEFKKPKYTTEKFYGFLPDYMDVIDSVISNTQTMYNIMSGLYRLYANECRIILKSIIEKGKKSEKPESKNESVAAFINTYTSQLKNIADKYTLNESVWIQGDNIPNISESLISLCNRFKDESTKEHEKRLACINAFRREIGPLLNSFNFDSIWPGFTYRTYANINIRVDASELLDKLNSNIDFVADVLKQYNKHTNFQLSDFISKLLMPGLQECLPNADTKNYVGVALTNISSKICGTLDSINPDIETISQNLIYIPSILETIDSHIIHLNELIVKSFSSIISTDRGFDQSHPMVLNITRAIYAYLAIILSIYRSYYTLESSAIEMVTAISNSIKQ